FAVRPQPAVARGPCSGRPNAPRPVQQLDLRLCGVSIVELEQAAESLTTLHLACADDRFLRRDELVAQALVRPFLMIMVDEFSDSRPELPFADQHHSVQALGLRGSDKSFGKRVQMGLHAGRTTGVTPLSRSRRRNAAVYSGSRSRMMCCMPRRKPSP